MNYAKIHNCDIANGTGIRVSLFCCGCRNHCPECFNPELQDFKYGKMFTREAMDEVLELLRPAHISGLTLLGGEPFEPENVCALTELAREVKKEFPSKTIWAYSGYTYEKLAARADAKELLEFVDILVDGPFVAAQKDLTLNFRGSRNQRIIKVPETIKKGEVVELV